MTAPVHVDRLPSLIAAAAKALASASTAAEILDATDKAKVIYDTAKSAGRWAKARGAHEEIMQACRKAMADALVIEAQAQCRLADEYDAAQARGEVQKAGGKRGNQFGIVPNKNNANTVTDIGLTSKQVLAARNIRDAEKSKPGIVRKAVEAKLQANEEPTRADIKRAVKGNSKRGGGRKGTVAPRNKAASKDDREWFARQVLDEGKTVEQVAAAAGVSVTIVKTAVERERGRREAEAKIDPDKLSMTAQKKLETAIRQAKRKLEMEWRHAVQVEVRRRMEENVLPYYQKKYAECEQVMKRRKGVMDRSTYIKILACLHPDRVQDETLKRRYEEAFRLFKAMEKLLLSEKESPTDFPAMPSTMAEWNAMKKQQQEHNRKQRSKPNGSTVTCS